MEVDTEIAKAYQPLFDLMANEHGKILTISEMDDIISAAEKVIEANNELYRIQCDIDGCNYTASTQGIYYKKQGYICLCQIHSQVAREDATTHPIIKQSALEREQRRSKDPNGFVNRW